MITGPPIIMQNITRQITRQGLVHRNVFRIVNNIAAEVMNETAAELRIVVVPIVPTVSTASS
jgi:hypothetical protein